MNIGVIFAGGVGTRMHSKELPKQFLEIHNEPIIIRTIRYFEENDNIDAVVVACVADWIDYLNDLIAKYHLTKVKKVVPGGETGQLSIYNGLKAAKEVEGELRTERCPSDDMVPTVVLIHDGVRPMISSELLDQNIASVREYGSCITAGVVTETIVQIDDDHTMVMVPDRAHSRVAKAPQSFYLDDILGSHERALGEGITTFIDSCTMMQHYGYKLHMIDGPYENIKITTPEDFYTMRAILQVKEDRQLLQNLN